MSRGFVVSDLHLFSRRSEANRYLPEMHRAASQASFFVFNGDTFDFTWTTYPTIEETVKYALEWVRAFVEKHPHCNIHMVLGNHDNATGFTEGLKALSAELRNFHFHWSHLKLGAALFLHGDVCNTEMDLVRLEQYRGVYLTKKKKGAVLNLLYDVVIAMRVHKVAYVTHPRTRLAKRILHFINSHDPALLNGVRHIYFGHTHAPFSDFLFRGISFHNTGSAIRGLKFNMREVQNEERSV